MSIVQFEVVFRKRKNEDSFHLLVEEFDGQFTPHFSSDLTVRSYLPESRSYAMKLRVALTVKFELNPPDFNCTSRWHGRVFIK